MWCLFIILGGANMSLAEIKKFTDNRLIMNDAMDELLSKLDVAIDDMEQGRVQPIDDAWKEINRIQGEIDKRYNVVIAESGKIDIIKKSNPMQP